MNFTKPQKAHQWHIREDARDDFHDAENRVTLKTLVAIFTKPGNRADGWVEYGSRGLQLRRRIEAALVRLCSDYAGSSTGGKDGADGA